VVVTGRSRERGREAVGAIRDFAGHDRVEFVAVDHSTVGANEKLAAVLISRFDHLDVLGGNVGGLILLS
jgi:NAD(P)-dependent dehydrogenase (short-subunit alcohol dehydrogenase family)